MKNFFVFAICLIMISCVQDSSSSFEAIINLSDPIEELGKEVLYSIDLHGSSGNKNYDKMYSEGKVHNKYLLNKALSEEITNFCIPNVTGFLSEGDIAIMLLLDINYKGSDQEWINTFVPMNLIEDYYTRGSIVWWSWIHGSSENRRMLVDKINDIL
jgi:hypothetical protein